MDDSPEKVSAVGDDVESELSGALSMLDGLEGEVYKLSVRYAGKKSRDMTAKQFGAIRGALNVLRDKMSVLKSKTFAAKEAAMAVAETAMNVAEAIEEKKENDDGTLEPSA